MAPRVLEHPGTRTTKGHFMATTSLAEPRHLDTRELRALMLAEERFE
jgi:hypothetical protein